MFVVKSENNQQTFTKTNSTPPLVNILSYYLSSLKAYLTCCSVRFEKHNSNFTFQQVSGFQKRVFEMKCRTGPLPVGCQSRPVIGRELLLPRCYMFWRDFSGPPEDVSPSWREIVSPFSTFSTFLGSFCSLLFILYFSPSCAQNYRRHAALFPL